MEALPTTETLSPEKLVFVVAEKIKEEGGRALNLVEQARLGGQLTSREEAFELLAQQGYF